MNAKKVRHPTYSVPNGPKKKVTKNATAYDRLTLTLAMIPTQPNLHHTVQLIRSTRNIEEQA